MLNKSLGRVTPVEVRKPTAAKTPPSCSPNLTAFTTDCASTPKTPRSARIAGGDDHRAVGDGPFLRQPGYAAHSLALGWPHNKIVLFC